VFAGTRSSFSKIVTASRQICERLREKFREASQRRRKLVALFRGRERCQLVISGGALKRTPTGLVFGTHGS
jgi:hypothetical protein